MPARPALRSTPSGLDLLRRLDLLEGLGLDLADALPAHVEARATSARVRGGSPLKPKRSSTTLRSRLSKASSTLAQVLLGDEAQDHLGRVGRALILDEVTELGVPLVADGGREGDGARGDAAYLLHFLGVDAELQG